MKMYIEIMMIGIITLTLIIFLSKKTLLIELLRSYEFN